MSYHERDTCRLCDAKLPDEKVLDLGSTPLANALVDETRLMLEREMPACRQVYPLYLKQCSTCGHVQLPVVVDPKLLFPEDYPYKSATSPVFRAHLEAFARDVPQPNDLSALEFGSNDGYLLAQLHARGLKAVGVDPALSLAREATGRGWLTLPYFFDEQLASTLMHSFGLFDLIVGNNVFAHAENLASIAEGVRLMLEWDGRFVFEVAYLPRMLQAGYFDCIYHEHLSFHHLTPLVQFFAKRGMVISDVRMVESQGGSMRVTVQHEGIAYPPEGVARVVELLKAEEETCSSQAVAQFARQVGAFRAEFPMRVRQLMAQGKKVAAFGCPAKATTLLHACGLHGTDIGYIVEENPLKQGKYSPGKHIRIVAPGHFDEHPVDVIVCLAWNFSEDIKKRYAHWPVEWVVPFE